MTNINPFKIIMKVRTAMWYLFFLTIGVWLLSSCEQKELCYDHNHASNVKVTFDWEQHPNANPASMCFYLFPREEGERTLKREFIGKNGGIAQALVGVSYTALGFNSDARNTSFRNNKGANLMLPKGTSPTDEYIINKVRSFNIESKTPMDCMMFLVDLKKKINGEV